jgi:hypothetical protein
MFRNQLDRNCAIGADTPRATQLEHGSREMFIALAIFVAAAATLFGTAPVAGDFWWQDAPRHALNGAFIKDLLTALPLSNPTAWAMQYYVKYPALTILFYPPAFYLVEACFYTAFGVTHATAQFAVATYLVLLGYAAHAIARMVLPRWSAIGVGLLVIGTPEISIWGRQVMLDVPAYALLMYCVLFMLRHVRGNRTSDLVLAGTFLVAAVYTKQTVIFMLPVLVVAFVAVRGTAGLLERRVLVTAAATTIALVPMIYLTMHFGAVNVESVEGRPSDISRWNIEAWLFYARLIPKQLGLPVAVLGTCGFVAVTFRPKSAGARWLIPLLVPWLVFGYLFFSGIGVREPRHDLMILYPILLCAALAVHSTLTALPAQTVVMALAGATFIYSLVYIPVPRITGYREVVDYIARVAPRDAVVLFSGYRDGNFIFDMRSREDRRDIITIRADKILLRVAVERERGVVQTDEDEVGIADTIRSLGVDLVVAQAGFWTDLRQMARLEHVLNSPLFERVAEFPLGGDLSTSDGAGREGGALVFVFRPTYKVEAHRNATRIEIPVISGHVEGRVAP